MGQTCKNFKNSAADVIEMKVFQATVIRSLASWDSLPNEKCLTLFLSFDWPN